VSVVANHLDALDDDGVTTTKA